MADAPPPLRSSNPDALREFNTGLDQKTRGYPDAALTSFRRAVIADPAFVEAHVHIGLLCKDKARHDRMFQRYAFEAFRSVARLDAANQQAHDQYILAAQESGRLPELHDEYEVLARNNPGNEVFQRCFKNIMTLEMAMIPGHVEVGIATASGTMRRFTLVISIGMIVVGLALVFSPIVLKRAPVGASHFTGLMKAGIGLIILGFGGIFAFTKMK